MLKEVLILFKGILDNINKLALLSKTLFPPLEIKKEDYFAKRNDNY